MDNKYEQETLVNGMITLKIVKDETIGTEITCQKKKYKKFGTQKTNKIKYSNFFLRNYYIIRYFFILLTFIYPERTKRIYTPNKFSFPSPKACLTRTIFLCMLKPKACRYITICLKFKDI